MDRPYWHKQTKSQPLFPNMEWSRPENKQQAGKLLIAGGNLHGFAAPAEAYAEAVRAGVGSARALLPECLKKYVGIIIENAEFAACTPSGSFSQKSLIDFLEMANWADATLFAGDFGRNSETAILLEKFLGKHSGPVTLTRDAVDYVVSLPMAVLDRPDTLLVLSLSQLQRLSIAAGSPVPVRFGMDLLQLVDWLHDFTTIHKLHIIVKHLDNLFVAVNGQISTTRLHDKHPSIWRLKTAAYASVWWLQNSSKPFDALSTSVLQSL